MLAQIFCLWNGGRGCFFCICFMLDGGAKDVMGQILVVSPCEVLVPSCLGEVRVPYGWLVKAWKWS